VTRTVTLAQLRSDIRFQADLVGASLRHGDAQITRLINQSINRFRERVTIEGATFYLRRQEDTLSAGRPSTSVAYQELDISGYSPAPVRTFDVDLITNGEVLKLNHVPFDSRNDYGSALSPGIPAAWAHFQKDTLAFFPYPNNNFSVVVYYTPVATDLVSDSDTFDGVAGWEDYITWDCVCRLIVRDQFPQAFQLALVQKTEIWTDILRTAARPTHAGGAILGRDTFGEKLRGMGRRLPPP